MSGDPGYTRESEPQGAGQRSRGESELFAAREPEKTPAARLPWIVAGAVVLVLVAVLVVAGQHRAPVNGILPIDAQAASLVFSDETLSESTSLSGGKSTYVDGTVLNQGTKTITGVTLQVLFANDQALPPQVETLPLALVRTREPYVDTQPVSAAPLVPGAKREFRLIFENIAANWNQQAPEIRVVHVSTQSSAN